MATHDEREGLPSASAALENSLCPGRWQAQRDYAAMVDEPQPIDPEESVQEDAEAQSEIDLDRDVAAGRRIHELYAGTADAVQLNASDAEVERAATARSIDFTMRDQWLTRFDTEPPADVMELREHRWWFRDGYGNKLYSGKADAVWIRGNLDGPCDVLVADLKGLWGQHDPAAINCQLRHYVALIAASIQEIGFTEVRSAMAYINQPAATVWPDPALFQREDLDLAMMEMALEISAVTDPDAVRTPGPIQCRRCQAKLICAEYLTAQENMLERLPATVAVDKATLIERFAILPGEKLAQYLEWAPTLINVAELAQAEARRRLKIDETCVPGWAIKNNPNRERVNDIATVYSRLSNKYDVSGTEFASLCSITKKNVIALIQGKTKLRGDLLAQAAKDIFSGAVKSNKVAPSLERAGKHRW